MRQVTKSTMRSRTGVPTRMPTSIRRRQRALSDRVHAAGDDRARQHGWQITTGTGRFGFGARSYRDARFNGRRGQLPAGVAQADQRDHREANSKEGGVRQ